MDPSNGYESIASAWLAQRGSSKTRSNAIGAGTVRNWAKTLPSGSSVIDLGCGPGIPLTIELVEAGLQVFGVDAAPSFVAAFQNHLPGTPVACESVLESRFFDRTFHAALAIGLIFLLSAEQQHQLMKRLTSVIEPGGRLLFTSPPKPHLWNDLMTGKQSLSLGAEEYRRQLSAAGFCIRAEYQDEGQNHYYDAIKA